MSDWSGAELRARITFLGFTIPTFAKRTGLDQRYLERVSTGRIGSVSQRIMDAVRAHEVLAEDELQAWDRAAEGGTPIYIPRLNQGQEAGSLPAHWYLALAGRHIDKWGTDAQIEWE